MDIELYDPNPTCGFATRNTRDANSTRAYPTQHEASQPDTRIYNTQHASCQLNTCSINTNTCITRTALTQHVACLNKQFSLFRIPSLIS